MKKRIKQKRSTVLPPTAPPLPDTVSSLESLSHFELAGSEDKTPSTAVSQTDDDEKEGSGDGRMGRSSRQNK